MVLERNGIVEHNGVVQAAEQAAQRNDATVQGVAFTPSAEAQARLDAIAQAAPAQEAPVDALPDTALPPSAHAGTPTAEAPVVQAPTFNVEATLVNAMGTPGQAFNATAYAPVDANAAQRKAARRSDTTQAVTYQPYEG